MSIIASIHNDLREDLNSINNLIISYLAADEEMIEEIGKYLIEGGGKRIRPLLTIITSKMFNYKGSNHIKLATAVEFIHAATLLHDDVVDGSTIRRFKPTANIIWGNKASILVGDFLFSQSFKLMVSTESIEALKILSQTASTIVEGEVSQLNKLKQQRVISREEYNSIIFAKTAELFGSACEVGAVIAGENSDVNLTMRNFGHNLGIIFQIKDDLLDYFGADNEIGKNIAGDFMEGKVTLPLILLHEQLPKLERTELETLIKQEERESTDFNKVLGQMKKHNIYQQVMDYIFDFKESTEKLLQSLKIDNIYKKYLSDLLEFAIKRSF